MRPQSSTATCFTKRTCPVSMSTSTTATWAPNVGGPGLRHVERRSQRARFAVAVAAVAAAVRGSPARPTSAPGRHAGHAEAAVVGQHDVGLVRFELRGREAPLWPAPLRPRRAPPCPRAGASASHRCRHREGRERCLTGRSGCPSGGARGGRRRSWRTTWRAPGRGPRCPPRSPCRPRAPRPSRTVRRPAGGDFHVGAHADAELPASPAALRRACSERRSV